MIHDTAVVEKGVELGMDVKVGPFCYISSGAVLGDGCSLDSGVTVYANTQIGCGCHLHSGCVIGDVPQDKNFSGGNSYVRVGDNCIIREGVTIHRGSKPGTTTEIGDGCFLMAFSHCAHNVKLGDGVILANAVLLGGYVEIGSLAFLSGNVSVHQFVKVGRLAMLGGNCAVNKDVPPFMTVRPLSLNEVGGMNLVGLKRAGFSVADRTILKAAYKLLYRSGKNASQAVQAIMAEYAGTAAEEVAGFVGSSKRGICIEKVSD